MCYNIPLQIFCLDRQSCQGFPLVHQKYIWVFSPKIVNKTITQLIRWPYRFFFFDWSFSSSLFFLFLWVTLFILARAKSFSIDPITNMLFQQVWPLLFGCLIEERHCKIYENCSKVNNWFYIISIVWWKEKQKI